MQWRAGKPVPPGSSSSGAAARTTAAPAHSPAPTPSRAVYGFLLFLLSNTGLLLYLVWALVPDPVLVSLGLHFFPQKYWAVAVPLVLSVLFLVLLLVLYPGLGLLNTPDLADLRSLTDTPLLLTDKHSPPPPQRGGREGGIPPVMDMPVKEVVKYLRALELSSSKKTV